MDHAALHNLRTQFAAFAGDEEYRRFLRTFNTMCMGKRRLLYWQEQLWREFGRQLKAEYSETLPAGLECDELDFHAIAKLFRICDVHDAPLQKDRVPVAYGLVHFSEEYLFARDHRFPFANVVSYGGCRQESDTYITVDYCEECRKDLDCYAGQEPALCALS